MLSESATVSESSSRGKRRGAEGSDRITMGGNKRGQTRMPEKKSSNSRKGSVGASKEVFRSVRAVGIQKNAQPFSAPGSRASEKERKELKR